MFKYFIFCFVLCSAIALKETDICPKQSEKPALLEKFCENKKFEVKKELTCVCEWFLFRNKAGECVSSSECEKDSTTEAPTTTTEASTTKPTPKPFSCPVGYQVDYVPCQRHGGYDGYDGKKCPVCKKPYYGQYPYGKYPYGKYPYGK